VAGNFYATLAQVFPLLLLTLVWESGFLARLRGQRRLSKWANPAGDVWFWTKPNVRWYTLLVTGVAIAATGVTVFVLAGVIPDSYALRLGLSCSLVVVLFTLLTRIAIDVLWATKAVPETAVQQPGRPETGSADAAGAVSPDR
jgi:hypothetical protein